MKKIIFFTCILLNSVCFAQSFHIKKVEYNIEGAGKFSIGKTNPYALEQVVPVDKKKYFENEEAFNNYLLNYKKQLNNTRIFEKIDITFEKLELFSTDELIEVKLNVYLKDSFHFLALPHVINYDSNNGWKPKLKAKDTNFLGSLNTMNGDFYAVLPIASENENYEVGMEFAFDLPFKAGIFDAEWVNDYTLLLDFSKPSPEWDAKTGIKLSFPINNIKLQLELYQSAIRDYIYEDFGDTTFYKEEAIFSVPINLFNIKNWGIIEYKPYTGIYYNWDTNGININNTELSSPTVTIGQSFHTKNVDWIGNYRKGAEITLSNDYYYYIQRGDFVPFISLEAKYYNFFTFFDSNYFNKLGFVTQLYTFKYFSKKEYYYGEEIGSHLRGIRDDQNYSNATFYPEEKALNTSTALVLNIDFPYHIMTTNFTSKFMSYFNCDVQVSPFIDIALLNNRSTGKTFSLKDGFYAGGFEVLVYPKKWSSFTVRASLGIDLGRYLFSDYLNNEWRRDGSKYELSIGLGLHY